MIRYLEQAFYAVGAAVMAILESALAAALLGRLVWHLRLVHEGERPLLGWHAVTEIFTVPMVYWAAMGLAHWLALDGPSVVGLTVIIAYIGPNGFQAAFEAYLRGSRR